MVGLVLARSCACYGSLMIGLVFDYGSLMIGIVLTMEVYW